MHTGDRAQWYYFLGEPFYRLSFFFAYKQSKELIPIQKEEENRQRLYPQTKTAGFLLSDTPSFGSMLSQSHEQIQPGKNHIN